MGLLLSSEPLVSILGIVLANGVLTMFEWLGRKPGEELGGGRYTGVPWGAGPFLPVLISLNYLPFQ